jgi:hypothetical protein
MNSILQPGQFLSSKLSLHELQEKGIIQGPPSGPFEKAENFDSANGTNEHIHITNHPFPALEYTIDLHNPSLFNGTIIRKTNTMETERLGRIGFTYILTPQDRIRIYKREKATFGKLSSELNPSDSNFQKKLQRNWHIIQLLQTAKNAKALLRELTPFATGSHTLSTSEHTFLKDGQAININEYLQALIEVTPPQITNIHTSSSLMHDNTGEISASIAFKNHTGEHSIQALASITSHKYTIQVFNERSSQYPILEQNTHIQKDITANNPVETSIDVQKHAFKALEIMIEQEHSKIPENHQFNFKETKISLLIQQEPEKYASLLNLARESGANLEENDPALEEKNPPAVDEPTP